MKLDIYFIHGWGFDKSFWKPVCKKIEENGLSRIAETIDLGFFSQRNFLQYNFQEIDSKSIFILHSYGLNWFLKNQIKCRAIINFFGVPNFLRFQKNPHITEKIITKMIENFSTNPSKVLKDFYRKCNVQYKQNKEVHIENCLKSLKQLKNEDLTENFNNLNVELLACLNQCFLFAALLDTTATV